MTAARARASAGLAAVAVALAVGVDASASSAIRPAPGTPDPKQMVLRSADLGGAKVTSQGYYKDDTFPSVISYARELEDGRLGAVTLLWVDSEAEVGTTVAASTRTLLSTRKLLGTKQGRAAVRRSLEEELPLGAISVGKPRNLGVGPGSFDLVLVVRYLGARAEFHLAAFRVDRVLGVLGVFGEPAKRLPLGVVRRLARVMIARMTAELAPRNTVAPTISGTPAPGQTLTATAGTWVGEPTSFAYQWQRCDAAGAACASIDAATGQTYLVSDADVGTTLRVGVTARNGVGSATEISAPTAVVQATGAPVNTAPPTITGTAQVGQTLSATTGTWSGSPTSFAFQWQRCTSAGLDCADIAGASGGTYVVSGSDVGSTLRVVVTATNAMGSTAFASAPSATVSS